MQTALCGVYGTPGPGLPASLADKNAAERCPEAVPIGLDVEPDGTAKVLPFNEEFLSIHDRITVL
jgi:hypothetical protein